MTLSVLRIIKSLEMKGLSQKLIIKLMAQPFAMQFCAFRQNKRKKPQNEAKKEYDEKRIG